MTALKTLFFKKHLLLVVAMLMATLVAFSQEKEILVSADTTTTTTIDSSKNGKKKVRVYNPGTAALRSAILPGLGQIYNKKYWKLPIVYGALGASGGIFIFNFTSYKDTRFAFKAKTEAAVPNATAADSVNYFKIKPPLQRYSLETLRYYRDQYRRDIDYSVLFIIVLWGLNVVDAAVDAHLKAFDVSPDLSFKLNPGRSQMAGTTGLSLVVNLGKNINPRPLKNTFIN